MKSAIAHLVGESPYSQSRHYDKLEVPAKQKETPDDYEQRTWRNRLHVTKDGFVEIPGSCFGNGIKETAKRLAIKIPGRGQATYTKAFESGVMVMDSIVLPVKAADVPFDKLFVPSDGKRGGGKRVNKWFPRIDSWEGKVKFYMFDDTITEPIFKQVLGAFGVIVGIGRFRPANCGFYGRFSVKAVNWLEEEETLLSMSA